MENMISSNIRFLRKRKGLTQEKLAQKIGIKRSLIGAYEEGRANPKFDTLFNLAEFFEVSIESILVKNLSKLSDDEFEDEKQALKNYVEGNKLRILPVVTDSAGDEKIVMVPQKAAASYQKGYSDPEVINDLTSFRLPGLPPGSYRAFEIEGDSMLPLKSGTIVVGEYVENWKDIKDGQTYIIVSENDGIVYKRVECHINSDGEGYLLLRSDNPIYPPFEVSVDSVKEVWKAKTYISQEFPEPEYSLERLTSIVMELQQEVIKMKHQ